MSENVVIGNLGSSSRKNAFFKAGAQQAVGKFEISGKVSIHFPGEKKEYITSDF